MEALSDTLPRAEGVNTLQSWVPYERCGFQESLAYGPNAEISTMPDTIHEQHLRELVQFPREDLNIELKGWLSPSNETDRANVAKALLALANTGGGYLLIGFDEYENGWAAAPNEGGDDFSQDVINQIIARYADPPFHCAVYHVATMTANIAHPVIVVPGNHRVPIRAKSEDPGRKHVKLHAYYIRRPGPCSDQPQSAQEWDGLINRCMLAAREDLLAAFRHIMQQNDPERPASADGGLQTWERSAYDRFHRLVKEALPSDQQSPYARGVWSVAYSLDGTIPQLDLEDFREVLHRVRGHETGWPPWWVPTRREIAPYPNEGSIECWMRESYFDGHWDFWRASPEGKLFLLRTHREDFEGGFEPGSSLVISSQLWTVGEVLLHAHRLAQALSQEQLRLAFRCRWDGLEGRSLASWQRRPGLPDHRSRTNEVTSELRCTTNEIADALPELVRRLTKPLFQAFDFFAPTPQFVEREIAELRKSRV